MVIFFFFSSSANCGVWGVGCGFSLFTSMFGPEGCVFHGSCVIRFLLLGVVGRLWFVMGVGCSCGVVCGVCVGLLALSYLVVCGFWVLGLDLLLSLCLS